MTKAAFFSGIRLQMANPTKAVNQAFLVIFKSSNEGSVGTPSRNTAGAAYWSTRPTNLVAGTTLRMSAEWRMVSPHHLSPAAHCSKL